MPDFIQVEVRNDNGSIRLVRNDSGVERTANLVVFFQDEEIEWFSNDGIVQILFGSTQATNPFSGDGNYQSTAVQSGAAFNAMSSLPQNASADYKYTVTLYPSNGSTPLSVDPRVRFYNKAGRGRV